ncbi:MAG: hypothetical protein LBU81_06475 [Methanosarcinales archaeon]|nr:hypothetical protein [Methanosarcinales archaeon]
MVISPAALAQENEKRIDSEEVLQEEVLATFTTNEYDMWLELKETPDHELRKSGYSVKDIAAIKNFSFEEALFERAQLSEEELHNMGYNDTQISLLKSYDGSPLEENPQMMAAASTFIGSITKKTYSKSNMSASFNWMWQSAPVIMMTDIVTCGFSAVGNGSIQRVVTATDVSSTATYIHDNIYNASHRTTPISYKKINSHVESKIPLSYNNGWAHSGEFTVKLNEAVSGNNLLITYFAFGYGHSTYSITPSISVNVGGSGIGGIGLSFASGTDAMYYSTMVLSHNGSTQIYNGL